MNKGWFKIPGVQDGDRSLEEQLQGLGPMLEEVRGRTVLDLGCAEGLIARACVEAGADRVVGFDNNPAFLKRATTLGLEPHRARFGLVDLNKRPDAGAGTHDVVLMLAILHKLCDPKASLRAWSRLASRLLVIRLPRNSDGIVRWKYGDTQVDTRLALPELGFTLERDLEGPRGERVHYWRRC